MATKWNDEFVERRMAQHRRWQHAVESEAIREIIDEVQTLPIRKPKSGQLFESCSGLMNYAAPQARLPQ